MSASWPRAVQAGLFAAAAFFLTAGLPLGGPARVPPVAAAAVPPPLAYRPEPRPWFVRHKGTFYQEITTVTRQDVTVQGRKQAQQSRQTCYFKWSSRGRTDGKYVVVQEILGVKLDTDIAGNKVTFDSTARVLAQNPLSEFFKQLLGTEFTLTIGKDKDGRYIIEDVEGGKGLPNKPGNVNQALVALLPIAPSGQTAKQTAGFFLGALPPRWFVRGRTWSRDGTLETYPVGTCKTRQTYRYAGQADGLARITVDTDVSFRVPPRNPEAGLPFKVIRGSLKGGGSGGRLLFNLNKGRVERGDLTVRLAGKLTIEIANMQTTVELSQTQRTRLRTTDRNPLTAKR
jgi:hypothetical protein